MPKRRAGKNSKRGIIPWREHEIRPYSDPTKEMENKIQPPTRSETTTVFWGNDYRGGKKNGIWALWYPSTSAWDSLGGAFCNSIKPFEKGFMSPRVTWFMSPRVTWFSLTTPSSDNNLYVVGGCTGSPCETRGHGKMTAKTIFSVTKLPKRRMIWEI